MLRRLPKVFLAFTYLLLPCMVFFLLASTIKSSGNVFFDPNNDGSTDQTINSDGLGINTTPTTRLHVTGNAAVINGKMGISDSTPDSTLSIQGTWGMSAENVSSSSTLSDNSVILVDTSSDNVTLQLPAASDVDGRIYHIKKKDDDNKVFISGGLIDGAADITMTTQSSPLPFLEIVSHDSQWFVLSGNGYELGLSGNLIAWWTFDATSGNELIDRSGNGNSGNLQNFDFSSNTTTGRMGNALSFDGTDDYIDLGNSDGIFMVSGVTVAVWYKNFSFARYIMEKANDFGSTHYTFTDNGFGGNARPRWIINSAFSVYSSQANSTGEIDNTNWHHIVGRYDGNALISDIWVNGVKQTDVETPSSTLSGSVTTRRRGFIGAGSYNGGLDSFFLGYMDDLRIYNKGLSDSEVQELFASGNAL